MNGILKLLLFIAKHEGMARKKSFFLEVSKVSKVEGFEGRLIELIDALPSNDLSKWSMQIFSRSSFLRRNDSPEKGSS